MILRHLKRAFFLPLRLFSVDAQRLARLCSPRFASLPEQSSGLTEAEAALVTRRGDGRVVV